MWNLTERETEEILERVETEELAYKLLDEYEEGDQNLGIYTQEFYKVVYES